MINVKILTGYPEMFPGGLAHSLMGKALKENIFSLSNTTLSIGQQFTNKDYLINTSLLLFIKKLPPLR